MEKVLEFLGEYALYLGIGIPAVIALVVPLILILRRRIRFYLRLKGIMEESELTEALITSQYSPSTIYHFSAVVARLDWKYNTTLHRLTGLDRIWVEKLSRSPSRKSYRFLLKFAVKEGLFLCFQKSLEGPWFRKVLLKWLAETGRLKGFQEIGRASDGSSFNGRKAYSLFDDIIDDIRNMAVLPEKALRYTAVKLLIHDQREVSRRVLWECFRDSYYRIRVSLAAEFEAPDRQRLYNELFKLYINDPVRQVRIAARERINADFSDLYSISISNLNDYERLHALEHLDIHSKADENLALVFLTSEKLEERFTAAVFLEKCGTLNRMMQQADLGDRQDLERKSTLLTSASDVRVTHFFGEAVRSKNRGTLLLAARILARTGRRDYIVQVCQTIFSLPLTDNDSQELFDAALECINLRGNEEAFRLLDDQLNSHRKEGELCCRILKAIPIRGVFIFKDTLLSFLTDDRFVCFDLLREIILKSPPYLFIEELFEILHYPRMYPLKIRKESLKILARMDTPDLTQNLLENLFLLERDEAEELASLIVSVSAERFGVILDRLMGSRDSSIRISLLLILPGLSGEDYSRYIEESLEDADPDVRIAAVRALVRSPGQKDFSSAIPLLRDPVGEVRRETALVLGSIAGKKIQKELENLVRSTEEVDTVRRAAVRGLGECKDTASLKLLSPFLEEFTDLEEVLKRTLSKRSGKEDVKTLIEEFREGTPFLREQLVDVFILMGPYAEEPLLNLLKRGDRDLVPYVDEVLESTGYIDNQAQKLSHRSSDVRLDAVEKLVLVASRNAYRALLPAAKDVNKKVRLAVFQGLSRLKTKEGMALLEELKEDPDRDIRRYAAWARNRIEALSS